MRTGEFQVNEHHIVVSKDINALSLVAASRILEISRQAIRERGACYLALSGGSTPRHLHEVLASAEFRERIEWDKLHIYFGDERNVPHDHPDSNYHMAQQTLLEKVPVPATQIYPMPTGCEDMTDCARRYAQVLSALPQRGGMPCFDLILLGMGNDGHTASLFPDTSILKEQHLFVAATYVDKLGAWRMSVTYPVLNQARSIMVLVSGAAKANLLNDIINKPHLEYPIQGIRNAHLEWYVDTAAAERLMESDVGISG